MSEANEYSRPREHQLLFLSDLDAVHDSCLGWQSPHYETANFQDAFCTCFLGESKCQLASILKTLLDLCQPGSAPKERNV